MRDEIERLSAELALARSDLDNLSSNTDIAAIYLDDRLHVRRFTPSATNFYDLGDASVGLPFRDLAANVEHMPPLPSQEAVRDVASRKGEGEVRVTRDGRAFRRRIAPCIAPDGSTDGVLVTFTDVTELEEAAERLEVSRSMFDAVSDEHTASASKLRALFEVVFIFTGVIDVDGVVREVNDTATTGCGYRREDIIGVPFRDCPWWSVSAEVRARAASLFDRALAGERVREDLPYRLADGRERIVDLSVAQASNDAGEVLFVVPSGIDVTAQRHLEQELRAARREAEAANEAKSAFLANMSHEIRTPMSAVLGYADLLQLGEHDAEKRGYIGSIKTNGYFLLGIINDILDLSRIEAGQLEADSIPFSPADLLAEVESMMAVRAGEKALTLGISGGDDLPPALAGDPKRLKQILVNLTGNAIKFTETGGVRIEVEHVDGPPPRLRLSVEDSGIGMDAANRSDLFQPFRQGDAAITRTFGGTGLGLAISQRLAGLLGGDITVESELGKGSRFTCWIDAPRVERRAEHRSGRRRGIERGAPPQRRAIGCRVLVVDDVPALRELLVALLSRYEVEVVTAEHGLDALEQARRMLDGDVPPVDLVLLDMQMPMLDGYATARRLRDMGFEAPIVALTADAMQSDMRHAIDAGCNDWLSKPVDAGRLLDLIERLTAEDRNRAPVAPGAVKVLIVEDSADAATVLQKLLRANGYAVRVARDGARALAEVELESPHVALLDIGLPDIDGLELVRRMKAMPSLARTRFIALSGRSGDAATKSSIDAGFDRHVVKPVRLARLVEEMAALLE